MVEINYSILFIQAFSFLIAVAVLWKIAWKPLTELLANRKKSIEDDLNKAKYSRENAIKLEEEYKSRIKAVEKEKNEILNNSILEGKKVKDEMIKDAQSESKNIIKNAEKELASQKNKAILEISEEIAELSAELAGKFLKEKINIKTQETMVRDFIKKLKNEK